MTGPAAGGATKPTAMQLRVLRLMLRSTLHGERWGGKFPAYVYDERDRPLTVRGSTLGALIRHRWVTGVPDRAWWDYELSASGRAIAEAAAAPAAGGGAR